MSLLLKNNHAPNGLPNTIRVSVGTAVILGLTHGKLDAHPTTAYLMTYKLGKCTANCGFCPQAKASKSSAEMLSRVTWPIFSTLDVLSAISVKVLEGKIRRVCIQALNYPQVFEDLGAVAREIKSRSAVAVSVSCQPQCRENIVDLANSGVDRIGIALDAATEKIFNKVKGKNTGSSYTWQNQFLRLSQALDVFGEANVSTHLIIGLGESEKQAVEAIQRCVDMGVLPAIFAFTPVRGTALEGNGPPDLVSYRRVQLARHLIANGKSSFGDMLFTRQGRIKAYGLTNEALNAEIQSGLPFQTSGCSDCNRPFYNEKPSGPIYNYPQEISPEEIEKIKKQLR